MWGRVDGVGRENVCGVGGEVEVEIEMVNAVTTGRVEDSVVENSRLRIGIALPFEDLAVSTLLLCAFIKDFIHIER